MRKLAFILTLLLSLNINSQESKTIDSLKNLINSYSIQNNLKDTIAIDFYNTLAETIVISNIDTATYYIQKSITLGKHLKELNLDSNTVNFHLCTSYMNLGVIYYYKGQNDNAQEFYNYSLQMARVTNNTFVQSSCLNNIGVLYYLKGDIENAIKYTEEGLELKANEATKDMVDSYSNLGNFYYAVGDVKKTLFYFEKANSICKKIDYPFGHATLLNNIGLIQYYQGNYKKALEKWESALKIRKELNDLSGIANSLSNIASVLDDLGEYEKAKSYFLESIDINKKLENKIGLIESYNNIGYLSEITKDIESAIKYYTFAYEIALESDHTNYIGLLSKNLGTIYYNKGKLNEAEKYAEVSYNLGHKIKYPRLMQESSDILGGVKVLKGEMNLADTLFRESISLTNKQLISNFETLSEKEQEKYFKTVTHTFTTFNSYALYRKDKNSEITTTVFNNTLKNKGLLLKSSTALRNSILASKDSVLIAQYESWISIKKNIAGKQANGESVDSLENIANEIEKSLVRNSNEFSDFKNIQKIDWKDVKNNLKSDEAAIEFIHFNYSNYKEKEVHRHTDSIIYCALILKHDSEYPEMIPLFEEKQLEKIIGKFGGNNLNYIQKLYEGNDLYELIWSPLKESLKSTKKVYLSPSGLLHRISFSALKTNSDVYLCDKYMLYMNSSSSKLLQKEDSDFDTKNKTATVFGGINYDSPESDVKVWDYLEGTEEETKQITSLIGTKINTRLFSGYEATEEEFKTTCKQSNIIHIATHGFFYEDPLLIAENEAEEEIAQETINFRGGNRGTGNAKFVTNENPLMRSGLVFSKANDVWNIEQEKEKEDGVLTAAEVAHIDLRESKLVVLSACETGLGDIKDSEGVYGLQRSFKMAGVEYIIMSLWQVPDKETKEFMILFYKNLLKTKNIETSFHKSQQKMRSKYDPYFWAAFVLLH